MKSLKISLIFLFICNIIFSQDSIQVNKGRMNISSGKVIVFKKLKTEGNEFIYFLPGGSNKLTINRDDVLKIEKKTGDNALLFGVVMGASGFLGAYLGSKMAESNLEKQNMVVDKNKQTTTILVLGGVSTLIGVIWGANVPKYKTVYTNPKYTFLNPEKFNLTLSLGQIKQFGIRYNF